LPACIIRADRIPALTLTPSLPRDPPSFDLRVYRAGEGAKQVRSYGFATIVLEICTSRRARFWHRAPIISPGLGGTV
jgi:hypothetical protein